MTTCLLSPLAAFSIRLLLGDLFIYIRAKRAGAVLPPHNPTWVPGAIHRIIWGLKTEETTYLGDPLEDLTKKFGHTFNLRVLFTNRIFTTEPEHIKLILASDFDHYEKGAATAKLMDPLLGVGVFNSDGAMWRFHRGMTRPFFSKDRISHFEIFDRHATDAIKQVKERVRQGYAVDVQDVVSRFTLDSATEFLFGMDIHSLSAGLNYPPSAPAQSSRDHPANKFADAFLTAQSVVSTRSRLNEAWKLLEFWKDRLIEPMVVIKKVLDPIIENALEKKGEKKTNTTGDNIEGETLLSHLVNLTDDHKIIRDETFNIMIAGRDTTASTLTFMLYMLSQKPQVLKRLRQEILDRIGPNARPTHDDLRDLKYLRATINETLRLFPAVPFNFRCTTQDVIWPAPRGGQPFFIPAGTRAIYSVFAMHRRTDLWGQDALEFDPDRFLDERMKKYLVPNPFIFLPFNAGPRICLGQQFAYNEISFMTIRLLQTFEDIVWDPEACPQSLPPPEWAESDNLRKKEEKVLLRSHLTMYAKNGYWVKFKEARH